MKDTLKIEWWPIDRPKPYAKNARKIPQKAIDLVAKSLREFGWQQAIVCDAQDVIIAGHTRLLAAKQEGMTHVPVSVAAHLTPAQVRAYRLMDNRSHEESSWDLDILGVELGELKGLDLGLEFTGFNSRELGKFNLDGDPAEAPDAQMDRAEELQQKWKVERGQIWEIGRHRLMCGDCTDRADVEALMQGEKVGAVVTDPPYGMNLDTDWSDCIGSIGRKNNTRGNKYDQVIGDDKPFDPSHLFEFFGKTKEIFLFGADYYAERIPKRGDGSWLAWDKRKESQADAIGAEFELIWSKAKHKRRILRHDWFGFLSSESGAEARNRQHPTQKPVALIADIIQQWALDEGIVIDPYLGAGATMVAAEQLDRVCYGLEIEPKYCAVILERMSAMGRVPELANERVGTL